MDYCLIGKTLKHSLSPQIHKEFGYNYEILELDNENAVKDFMKSLNFKGFNVTIPYKQTVMKYLDFISDEAKNIGAVNTVINDNGILKGYNTDIKGLIFAINNANIKIKNKVVAILGSGGTSKTAQYMCKILKAKKCVVVSRTGKINYNNVYDLKDIEVIINTTPVGMIYTIDETPVDISKFENLESVFDAIYNPLETKLINVAKIKNLNADNGLNMLVEQARVARNIFLNNEISQNVTLEISKKLDCNMRNLVFVGMPGCGKSTIGYKVAKKLNREFIDTDVLIEKKTGLTIPEIFEKYGEAHFRKLEAKVIKEVSKKLGVVISTGGGAIENKENVKFLKLSGKIIYLVRNNEMLDLENRPLSNEKSIIELFKKRSPIYEKIADLKIYNNEKIGNVVNKIIKES